MHRVSGLSVFLAAGLLLGSAGVSAAQGISEERVREVHRSALLIDLHNDVTSDTVKGLDIGLRRSKGHTDLPRLREGGVGAVFFAAYVSRRYVPMGRSAHREKWPPWIRLADNSGFRVVLELCPLLRASRR